MERRIRGCVISGGLVALALTTGCQSPFARRGIPPEPRNGRDGGLAQFGAEPKPFGGGMGSPAAPMAPGAAPSPYGTDAPYGGEPAMPVEGHSNMAPPVINPGNSVEEIGQMGSPGQPPSPL